MQTQLGKFRQDPSGLWHYNHGQAMGRIEAVVADALAHKPDAPAWFWFNGTPAGIHPRDTPETLQSRWEEWRTAYQNDPPQFLTCLAGGVKPR